MDNNSLIGCDLSHYRVLKLLGRGKWARYTWPGTNGSAGRGPPRIAVLPFEKLDPEEEAFFANGITDEIASRLALVNGLAVISRTNTTSYHRRGKSVAQIAHDLDAAHILEGSIRWQHGREGSGRVRIVPHLVRAVAMAKHTGAVLKPVATVPGSHIQCFSPWPPSRHIAKPRLKVFSGARPDSFRTLFSRRLPIVRPGSKHPVEPVRLLGKNLLPAALKGRHGRPHGPSPQVVALL